MLRTLHFIRQDSVHLVYLNHLPMLRLALNSRGHGGSYDNHTILPYYYSSSIRKRKAVPTKRVCLFRQRSKMVTADLDSTKYKVATLLSPQYSHIPVRIVHGIFMPGMHISMSKNLPHAVFLSYQ